MFFDYDKNQNPTLADDQAPLCCEYIGRSQEFLTPVVNTLKSWNALNGSVKYSFSNLSQLGAEITAFSLDHNKKRFILGDSRGQVRVYNLFNGELMKTLEEHGGDAEILNVLVARTKEINIILTVGTNNVVMMHEDDKLEATSVRRKI